MIPLPSLTTLFVFLCAGGGRGVMAAPREGVPIKTPLELTLPAIPSDPYIHSDYIDNDKNPVPGSGSKIRSCSITPLIDHKSLQPLNQPLYPGFCATSAACGDSYQGVSFIDSAVCGAQSPSFQCCIPPSKPISCAAPHQNSKCLNSNKNRKAECVGGSFVKGLCPGSANDDVQCCVLPQDAGSDNKELKDSYHAAAAGTGAGPAVFGAVVGDGSGAPMDWGYDDAAETESAPRYEKGSEAARLVFPAQDTALVNNRVEAEWVLQG